MKAHSREFMAWTKTDLWKNSRDKQWEDAAMKSYLKISQRAKKGKK